LAAVLSVTDHAVVKKLAAENIAIAMLCCLYIGLVHGTIHFIINNPDLATLCLFNKFLFYLGILFSVFFVFIKFILKQHHTYLKPHVIFGFIFILWLSPLYISTFASYKQAIPYFRDFSWDYDFMALDRIVHFGRHPWEILGFILNNDAMVLFLDRVYMTWFGFLTLFSLWMGWSKRRNLRKVYFISTIVVWSVFGSGLGTVFYSAGPCYYQEVVGIPDPYSPLMERLDAVHEKQTLWAVSNQNGLWEAKMAGKWLPFGGISAMPSVHVAMAMVFALTLVSVNPILGTAGFLYVGLIQIGAVVLGWHYAVDGYAGIILTLILWKLLTGVYPVAPSEQKDRFPNQ
jgi:hypothetical protein